MSYSISYSQQFHNSGPCKHTAKVPPMGPETEVSVSSQIFHLDSLLMLVSLVVSVPLPGSSSRMDNITSVVPTPSM